MKAPLFLIFYSTFFVELFIYFFSEARPAALALGIAKFCVLGIVFFIISWFVSQLHKANEANIKITNALNGIFNFIIIMAIPISIMLIKTLFKLALFGIIPMILIVLSPKGTFWWSALWLIPFLIFEIKTAQKTITN